MTTLLQWPRSESWPPAGNSAVGMALTWWLWNAIMQSKGCSQCAAAHTTTNMLPVQSTA